jgi:hypothetical protein
MKIVKYQTSKITGINPVAARPYSVPRQLVRLALSAQYPYNRQLKVYALGQLAQLVEQGIENPCVLGSIPRLATTL